MKDSIKFYVQLSSPKKLIKAVGIFDSLKDAKAYRDKRKTQPNQTLWIGKYVNGVLAETY